jgi:hypothetical protein
MGLVECVVDYAHTHRHCGAPTDLVTFSNSLSVNALVSLLRRHKSKDRHYKKSLLAEILALRGIEEQAVDSLKPEVMNLARAHFGQSFDIQSARQKHRPVLRLLKARQQRPPTEAASIESPAQEGTTWAGLPGAFGWGVEATRFGVIRWSNRTNC